MPMGRILTVIVAGLTCILLTGCVTIRVSPAWEITNVDHKGQPITKALMASQVWGYDGLKAIRTDQDTPNKEGLVVISEKKITADVIRWVLAPVIVFLTTPLQSAQYGAYGAKIRITSRIPNSHSVTLDPTNKKIDEEVAEARRIWKVDIDDDGVARCTLIWDTDHNGKPTRPLKIAPFRRVQVDKR